MRKIDALKSVKTVHGLADLLGFKASALGYILFKLPDPAKYKTFTIPKRSGGERLIAAPVPRLMLLQKKISILLNDCLAEIEGKFSSPAHGFKVGHSIFTNAARHRARRYVLNLDLEDFFPSIHFGRIVGYFEKSRDFGLDPKIARILANVLCHRSALPQGAPSSPVMSNLLARMLDVHLARLAKRNRLSYTRYADDLTFSTNLKVFPTAVAKQVSDHTWELGADVISTIQSCGFKINNSKTRMQYRSSRQEVTGLVVNDIVSVPIEYRRWVRAAVARLVKTGTYFKPIPKEFVGPLPESPGGGTIDHLEGCLSHIYNSHRFQRSRVSLGKKADIKPVELHSDERVYRRFLFYSRFYAPSKPMVVCEGETDSIYISAAIAALGAQYPELIDTKLKPGERDRVKVRIFKHGPMAARLLDFDGGTSQLKNFCGAYIEAAKKFKGGGLEQPTIVVVDNDDAGRGVVTYAQGIARNQGLPIFADLDYTFIRPNLYVVRTPPVTDVKNPVIEHLFSERLLNTKLGGKTLTLSNKAVGEHEYGKMYFAKYVVPLAEPDDFLGFQPLLDTLVDVLADFASRVHAAPAVKKV